MAGRKRPQLQLEVTTSQEWREVLKCPDLSVVDVYNDWSGPCTAMLRHLEKFKLQQSEEGLNLVRANCDTIAELHRFRGHSEPTWMFLVNGQLVNIYIGCNGPVILRLIKAEIEEEKRIVRGEARRSTLPFDKITAAERQRLEKLEAFQRLEIEDEEERLANALNEVRMRNYENLASALPQTTVVIFFPHALTTDGDLPDVARSLRNLWRGLNIHVIRQEVVDITDETANEIFSEKRLPQLSFLIESLKLGPCVVLLLEKIENPDFPEGENDEAGADGDATARVPTHSEGDGESGHDNLELGFIERLVAETIYGFYPDPVLMDAQFHKEEMDQSVRSSFDSDRSSYKGIPLKTDHVEDEIFMDAAKSGITPARSRSVITDTRSATMDVRSTITDARSAKSGKSKSAKPEVDDEGSIKSEVSLRSQESLKLNPRDIRPITDSPAAVLLRRFSEENVVLPGIWTPLTPFSKAAAIRVLFGDYALQFYEEEVLPPPPPAAAVIIFDSQKRNEVQTIANEHPDSIIFSGFFNDERKKITDTIEEYEELKYKMLSDKFVLGVVREHSETILALTAAGPTYLSPNPTIAKRDINTFFKSTELADSLNTEELENEIDVEGSSEVLSRMAGEINGQILEEEIPFETEDFALDGAGDRDSPFP